MRSLKNKFLGKWVTLKEWGVQCYFCLGESDEYIYIYYDGYGFEYEKDLKFKVIRGYIPEDKNNCGWEFGVKFFETVVNRGGISWDNSIINKCGVTFLDE